MIDHEAGELNASFIEGSRGHLFCLHALPKDSRNHTVLLIPAFAEEMNSCRRFFTLMRIQLCQQGFTVIQPDLYGTGDSQGLFQDASWKVWMQDLGDVIDSLLSDGKGKLTVLSIRSGCLLAQDVLSTHSEVLKERVVDNLVFLQPELSGYQVLNKLLRLKAASSRLAGNSSETTKSLWGQFEQQTDVHSAGYLISHELALQMRESRLNPEVLLGARRGLWVEMTPDSNTEVVSSAWQKHRIMSKPFWQSHEIEPEQSTVEAIAELVNE